MDKVERHKTDYPPILKWLDECKDIKLLKSRASMTRFRLKKINERIQKLENDNKIKPL